MEILNNFGFQPVLFAAQIVNFLILAYIFKRFLYKPILKTLKERQHKIEKGLEDSEIATQQRLKAEEEKESIVKKASFEAQSILAETERSADELKEKILNEAKKESEKILERAKKETDVQMEAMEKRVKAASLTNSMNILEKVLSDLFTKSEKEKILERSMKSIKTFD